MAPSSCTPTVIAPNGGSELGDEDGVGAAVVLGAGATDSVGPAVGAFDDGGASGGVSVPVALAVGPGVGAGPGALEGSVTNTIRGDDDATTPGAPVLTADGALGAEDTVTVATGPGGADASGRIGAS